MKTFLLASIVRSFRSYLPVAATALALSSCATVTSQKPIGETPARLDPHKWNGTWGTGDGHTLCLCVKSADQGLLEVGYLEAHDNEVQAHKYEVHVTQAGGWLWASTRDEGHKDYLIARLSEPDEHLLAWMFESPAILTAVKAGQLPGDVVKDDKGQETKNVLLHSLSDAQLQDIKAGKYGDVFNWGKPALVLTHLKD